MPLSQAKQDLAPLAAWLPALDRVAVLEMVGERACARAERAGGEVVGAPIALRSQVIHAKVADGDARPHAVSAGKGREGELACRCDCAAFAADPPCEHVALLLLHLAASDELRAGLVRGEPSPSADDARAERAAAAAPERATHDRLRALTIARDQGFDPESVVTARRRRRSGMLELTFHGWRRRGEIKPIGDATFFVSVDPADPDELDSAPQLHIRVQPDGERKPFGPDDLESRRLPAAEWRLLEPLARSPAGSKHFVAAGSAATIFLDRAAEAGVRLLDDASAAPIHVRRSPLRPALRLRCPGPGEISSYPAVALRTADARSESAKLRKVHERYQREVGAIELGDFTALLGLSPDDAGGDGVADDVQILEATWLDAEHPLAASPFAEAALPPTPFGQAILLTGPHSWVYLPQARSFARVARDVGPIALARLAAQPLVLVSASEVERLPSLLRQHFRSEGVVLPSREQLGLAGLPLPRIVLRVSGSLFAVRAVLEAHYPSGRVPLTEATLADPDDAQRNYDAERAALEQLDATSLAPAARRRGRSDDDDEAAPTDAFVAEGDRAVGFWTSELPALVAGASSGGPIAEVVTPPGLRQLAVRSPIRASLSARAGRESLIDVALQYASEGVPADVEEIRQALAAKRRWVKLTDGSVAELSERVAALAAESREAFRRATTTAELPRYALGEVEAWAGLADSAELDDKVRRWAERLRAVATRGDIAPIAGLNAELRAYQRVGVAWLEFLADVGLGGVLADDMGLGKTVQALALLAWRRQAHGQAPSLVVAPTSVAPNWIREAQRFVPDLNAVLLHGADRHARYDEVPRADIAVTTYALLRRDVDRLRDLRFRYVILDEAQQIKNHTAATTAAAKSLHAEARLALTGTPVENRLLELWSILDFCNPGMLGSWRTFSRRYERPVVEALADGDRASRAWDARGEAAALRARIRPFVLRRTKAEVQSDLPPKIETDVVVELTPAQRRAYAALAAATRADLGPRVTTEGVARNRMLILTALLRLRQMACDPRLVDPKLSAEDSAKLIAFRDLVAEVVAGGRRALVFSQFVELLTLLRADLDERGIEYCYLDGRTRDRAEVLRRFAEGTMPLFLLSLRAGGTGINLAAADVVIHLDPWWNPAVEDQATDRAHRIGQTKTVSVYRIVAAGTIEEAILRMKQHKRALASAVIEDDLSPIDRLGADDLAELLAFTG